MRTPSRQVGGFLLEVSMVLLVVGVLTAATFQAQSAMRKRQQDADARNVARSVDAALRAFVLKERRMPCPASDDAAAGQETRGVAGGCAAWTGGVPFITLGMEMPQLAQGAAIRYGVAPEMYSVSGLLAGVALIGDGAGTGKPYVAAGGSTQRFTNCNGATFNPAYAVMWASSGMDNVPAQCFRQTSDGSMGLLAVGGAEFYGWLQANLRP